MADCGCSRRCTCTVTAGPGVTVGGNGSTTNPYIISASAAVARACGLTGDGSPATPLAAAVGTWTYPCALDANAGHVYCDSTGQLRGEPRPLAAFTQDQQVLDVADVLVPAPRDTEVATHSLTIPNPDSCRPAFVVLEAEADADFNLPPASGAALGITTDEMSYVANNGSTTLLDVHTQGTKVINLTIPAGGSLTFNLSIRMGRGSGGATYNRVQSFLRAFVFVL